MSDLRSIHRTSIFYAFSAKVARLFADRTLEGKDRIHLGVDSGKDFRGFPLAGGSAPDVAIFLDLKSIGDDSSSVLSALLRFVRMFLQGRPCARSVLLTFSWSLVEADSILGGRRGDQLPPRMEDACWLFCTNASKADLVQGRLMHILATCTMLFIIDRHYCFISFVIHVFNFLTSSMLVYLLALGPVVD